MQTQVFKCSYFLRTKWLVVLLPNHSLISTMDTTDLNRVAFSWLAQLSLSLEKKDAASCASLFHSNGWLRDLLVFSWNLRTLNGHERILEYLSSNMDSTTISDLKITSDNVYFKPSPGSFPGSVSSGFTFSTPIANGRGLFTLTPTDSESGSWKAFTLLVSLDSLKGHEQSGAEQGVYHGSSLNWSEVREQRARMIEANPRVLIVGAGQNGLQVAARFKQMNIPTLVIEKNERVGDQWRKRYPSLTLHTPKRHHTMLFQPYPENWPRFTPRDKVADWLEQYAISQDLVVWTKSQPLPVPSYDKAKKEWTVSINRDGRILTIHPQHIILATGTLGGPYTPTIKDCALFKGQILHSDSYAGGPQFVGKRIIVVGTGNSGADIALDLHVRGARTVTIVQRSVTCVQSSKTVNEMTDQVWREDVPTEVADYRSLEVPFQLKKQILKERKDFYWKKDQALLEGLAKAGLKVNLGPDGSGAYPLVYERLGGYWMDVGCADYIVSGKIKVKSGVEIKKFLENALLFEDDTVLEADMIIFATGFVNIRTVMKGIFGDAIDKSGPAGGVDEEGEMNGAYRPTGRPGLWYAPGDFLASRFGSKLLAIQLQAIELGYMKEDIYH
ncbi:FAD/NAD-P-binding domain-containing protein [Lentinula aciculospora]|uniref:FAD/NAD-P-binding domain-containing protein n=1 Tax=Lentinula aciculospora TaxID=153920 RepID=A0A9W9AAP6_9AGAR|nr:FAD/NAD-P-binding domain-containing protein [Lentinula aciculospora]